jgi:RNA polymerase-binding transcription factor DksA
MPRYIDAEKLKADHFVASTTANTTNYLYVSLSQIESAPTADVVERKKGKWIKMSDADGVYWACRECGEDIPRVSHFDPQFDLFPRLKSLKKTNFCSNCGAKMEEEDG